MERVFEKAVATALRTQLPQGHTLDEQQVSGWLASRMMADGRIHPVFPLKPDMVVHPPATPAPCMVLDAKWERLQNCTHDRTLYQLKAYGDNYLENGTGPVVLSLSLHGNI